MEKFEIDKNLYSQDIKDYGFRLKLAMARANREIIEELERKRKRPGKRITRKK